MVEFFVTSGRNLYLALLAQFILSAAEGHSCILCISIGHLATTLQIFNLTTIINPLPCHTDAGSIYGKQCEAWCHQYRTCNSRLLSRPQVPRSSGWQGHKLFHYNFQIAQWQWSPSISQVKFCHHRYIKNKELAKQKTIKPKLLTSNSKLISSFIKKLLLLFPPFIAYPQSFIIFVPKYPALSRKTWPIFIYYVCFHAIKKLHC